jgi:hypothetical protein
MRGWLQDNGGSGEEVTAPTGAILERFKPPFMGDPVFNTGRRLLSSRSDLLAL